MRVTNLSTLALIPFTFAAASAFASSIIIDTGSPALTQNGAVAVCGATTNHCEQSVALKFSVNDSYSITDIEGYLWTNGVGGSLTLALYSDNGGPGTELYSSAFNAVNTSWSSAWSGVHNIDWLVEAGSYWAAFEVRDGQSFYGALEFPAPMALPAAINNPTLQEWTLVGGAAGGGLIVSGSQVASVPLPSTIYLLGSAIFGLVASRERFRK